MRNSKRRKKQLLADLLSYNNFLKRIGSARQIPRLLDRSGDVGTTATSHRRGALGCNQMYDRHALILLDEVSVHITTSCNEQKLLNNKGAFEEQQQRCLLPSQHQSETYNIELVRFTTTTIWRKQSATRCTSMRSVAHRRMVEWLNVTLKDFGQRPIGRA